MTTLLTTDILIKLLTWVGGPLLVGLIIYYKGYSSGSGREISKQAEAKAQQEAAIRGANAKNASADWRRDQEINRINSLQSVTDLVTEWNKRWGLGRKGPDDKDIK